MPPKHSDITQPRGLPGPAGAYHSVVGPRPVRPHRRLCARRAVHNSGILHGDFKTLNLLVGADQRVKVADFGLSKVPAPGCSTGAEGPRLACALLRPVSAVRVAFPERSHRRTAAVSRRDGRRRCWMRCRCCRGPRPSRAHPSTWHPRCASASPGAVQCNLG